MTDDTNLEGKIAAVTGAASGQGLAVAVRLCRQGAIIAAIDQNEQGLRNLRSTLQKCDAQYMILEADISDAKAMENAFSSIEGDLGNVDILAAAAAICPIPAAVEQMPFADIQKVMDVNILGSFYCGILAARQMIQKKKGGRIIFWSSIGAQLSLPGHAAYCASKGAVESMTRSFAQDLGSYGILVNAIAPGAIDTPMLEIDDMDLELSVLPVGRIGTPEEIADLVLFLCSKSAGFITGSILSVDGGGKIINGSVTLAQKIRQTATDCSIQ